MSECVCISWPVKLILQSLSYGAQICDVSDHSAVCWICLQVHRQFERCSHIWRRNRTSVKTISGCICISRLFLYQKTVSMFANYVTPKVQSWLMPLMMRSHSSSRVREPHSPSRGLYSNAFCSSSVRGTLRPNSSGNTATQRDRERERGRVTN